MEENKGEPRVTNSRTCILVERRGSGGRGKPMRTLKRGVDLVIGYCATVFVRRLFAFFVCLRGILASRK